MGRPARGPGRLSASSRSARPGRAGHRPVRDRRGGWTRGPRADRRDVVCLVRRVDGAGRWAPWNGPIERRRPGRRPHGVGPQGAPGARTTCRVRSTATARAARSVGRARARVDVDRPRTPRRRGAASRRRARAAERETLHRLVGREAARAGVAAARTAPHWSVVRGWSPRTGVGRARSTRRLDRAAGRHGGGPAALVSASFGRSERSKFDGATGRGPSIVCSWTRPLCSPPHP